MKRLRVVLVLGHLTVISAGAAGLAPQLPAVLQLWLDLAGGPPRPRPEAPVTMHLEVQTGEERSPVPPSWNRALLTHPRTRMALARHAIATDPLAFDQLGTWISRLAAPDFPEASHLHARLEPATTPPLRFSLEKQR